MKSSGSNSTGAVFPRALESNANAAVRMFFEVLKGEQLKRLAGRGGALEDIIAPSMMSDGSIVVSGVRFIAAAWRTSHGGEPDCSQRYAKRGARHQRKTTEAHVALGLIRRGALRGESVEDKKGSAA